MKVMLPVGILSAATVAACVSFRASHTIYSVNVYASGTYYIHNWLVGSPGRRFGLLQCGEYRDARGFVIIDAGHETERGGIYQQFTRVEADRLSFKVPLRALAVATIGAAAILGAGGLLISILLWMRQSSRDKHTVT